MRDGCISVLIKISLFGIQSSQLNYRYFYKNKILILHFDRDI